LLEDILKQGASLDQCHLRPLNHLKFGWFHFRLTCKYTHAWRSEYFDQPVYAFLCVSAIRAAFRFAAANESGKDQRRQGALSAKYVAIGVE
jgi:hypothetical protein